MRVEVHRKKCFYRCAWSACRKRLSVTTDTILDKTKLRLDEWILVIYFWSMQTPFEALVKIMKKTLATIGRVTTLTMNVISKEVKNNKPDLGGPGTVTEIDETENGTRKKGM